MAALTATVGAVDPAGPTDGLFDAFTSQGLALAALAPRTLALVQSAQAYLLLDDDGRDTTFIRTRGVLEQWLQIQNAELGEPAFAEQWQEQLAAFEAEARQTLTAAQDYAVGQPLAVEPAYGFFPSGALTVSRQRTQRRQLKIAAGLLVGLLGLAASPFLAQSFELQMAIARLESNRELSVEARQDQAVVVEFENRWGAINEFPQQNVAAAMFRLQEVLAGEQLSSLELSEGLIRIQVPAPTRRQFCSDWNRTRCLPKWCSRGRPATPAITLICAWPR